MKRIALFVASLLIAASALAQVPIYTRGPSSSTSSVPSTAFPLVGPDGSASAPTYSFSGQANTGMWRAASSLVFTVAGTNAFQMFNTSFLPLTAGTDLGTASNPWKRLYVDYTNTGTVGSVTLNKAAGRVNLAAAGTTLTLTNSFITAASHVFLQVSSLPGNAVAVSCVVVPAAGSAAITCTPAVTNQISIDFVVVNAD